MGRIAVACCLPPHLPCLPVLQAHTSTTTPPPSSPEAISLGELKTAITKKAESVRTGMDNCGNRYINEYTLLEQLGVGAYGTVYQVVNTYNEQVHAGCSVLSPSDCLSIQVREWLRPRRDHLRGGVLHPHL